MKMTFRAARILDFDIENRPLSYLGSDFTTCEVTAIAASFDIDSPPACWMLGEDSLTTMLEAFRVWYDDADMVTGHYIRMHDLPIINGAMLELGLRPLKSKLSCDTKLDLMNCKGISKSQESLAAMLGIDAPKVQMTQADWRAANRLERLDLTYRRVTGDVVQHQALRLALLERGMLSAPKVWSPKRAVR